MRPGTGHMAAMQPRAPRRRGLLSSQRGQASVETAIAVVVLVGFMLSVIDGALLFWTYLTLENGITEATRFAITQQQLDDPNNPGGQLSRIDSIEAVMRQQSPPLGQVIRS